MAHKEPVATADAPKSVQTDAQVARVQHWITLGTRMQDAKDHYSQRWERYERTFKMFEERREGEDEWRASLPDTWSYATVKTAQAAFVESRIVPVFSRHEKEDKMKTEDMRDLYMDIADKGDMPHEMYFVRMDSFKVGMGFTKTVFVEDPRVIQQIIKFDHEKGILKFKEEKINDFDDPKTVRVSPWLMLVDEMAKSGIETARRCIEIEILGNDDAKRTYKHLLRKGQKWEDVVKDQETGINFLRNVKGTKVGETADENTGSVELKLGESFRFFAPFELEPHHVVLLHCYDKIDDTYELIGNGGAIKVKADSDKSPIPYVHKQLPYTDFPYSPYGGDEFWAAGIIELGWADAKAIQKHNEKMDDRQTLSLFSPAFSDTDDEIDQQVLKLAPMSIIRTKGGVPTQWTIPGITQSDIGLREGLEDSYKRTTGIDERVLGVAPRGGAITATEVEFLVEAALRRLKDFSFLYKRGILREVKLKISLFKQYYASPIKREPHVKEDQGVKVLAKTFKKKTGNTYSIRSVSADLFNEEKDIDVEMRVLIPMSMAQMVTKWGQILRDLTPFVEAGLTDIDLGKVVDNYVEALNVSPDSLRADVGEGEIKLAEGEHRLLINKNTSERLLKEMPNGTPLEFLSPAHLQRHRQLMELEDNIEPKELKNLILHIAKDTENLRKKMSEEQKAQEGEKPLASQAPAAAQTGGTGGGAPPRLPEASVKRSIKREGEEKAQPLA